jgi:hypothetical protein
MLDEIRTRRAGRNYEIAPGYVGMMSAVWFIVPFRGVDAANLVINI